MKQKILLLKVWIHMIKCIYAGIYLPERGMNGNETAWQLIAKCKQSENEFLAFAGAGGVWSYSTACEGTCGSFPKHPDGSLSLWLLRSLEKIYRCSLKLHGKVFFANTDQK